MEVLAWSPSMESQAFLVELLTAPPATLAIRATYGHVTLREALRAN